MNNIPPIGAAFVPSLVNAGINAAGAAYNAAVGNGAQRVGAAGLNSGNTYETAKQWISQLNPAEQARLQNEIARQAGQDSLNQQIQAASFNAGLGNTAANLNTERAMALNAQQNAANNVANQLSNLSQARSTNANAIAQAMQTAAGMFR